MRKLTRDELRTITGGVKNLIGWQLTPQGCLCDFYNVAAPNNVICGVSCPDTMCTDGSIDRNPHGAL